MNYPDMKELGGYFELELKEGHCYHLNALALNSARNCFRYILRAQRPNKVYLPAYCCDSLIEPLLSENIAYEFYHINESFELTALPLLKRDERLLYINSFALKSKYIKFLHFTYGDNLIVDNTQAFFEKPLDDVDTFYSARKFFGVADGGYLYTRNFLVEELEFDQSIERFTQLIGRYEKSASCYYSEYQQSEKTLINQPIKLMSRITQGILKSLDYEKIALIRQRNFWVLHTFLKKSNKLKFIEVGDFVPMVYPYKSNDLMLRERLIKNRVYVAKYWADAEIRTTEHERKMIEKIICLPIDQRVDIPGINKLLGVVNG